MNSMPDEQMFPSDNPFENQADLPTEFFVDRLQRLLELPPLCLELSEDEATSLLRRAIYSTYRDLRALGWEPAARRLLESSRTSNSRECEGLSL